MNIHQESLSIFKLMHLLLRLWLDSPLFVLLACKYSPNQTLKGLTGSLLQHVFPKFQFLCSSRLISISCNLSLPQFTSLLRLTFNGVRKWDLKEMTPRGMTTLRIKFEWGIHTETLALNAFWVSFCFWFGECPLKF